MVNRIWFILFITLVFGFFTATPIQAIDYYVSPAGSGSICSITAPCTLNTGIGKLASVTTVYLRGGSYLQTVSLNKSGTLSGYPGETAIIDGNNSLPSGSGRTYSPLVLVSGASSVLRDVTVANSRGEGIEVTGTSVQLINVYVHHSGENGIILKSNNSVCDGCRAWSNAMSNQGGTQSGGWGTGISACRSPQHAIIRNSVAWENWGEGISTFGADYTIMEDNISYNNWSVNMYIQNVQNALVQRNLIYSTSDSPIGSAGNQNGIVEDNESPDSQYGDSANNTYINNFVMGTKGGFVHWSSSPAMQNAIISNNTFVNAGRGFANIDITGTSVNSVFKNNIILQTTTGTIASIDGGITLSNNIWSKTFSGKGTTDVVGDPKLAMTGTISSGTLTGDWFKLTPASVLALDKASIDSNVTNDFFKNTRPIGSAPDIGGHEYSPTSPSPSTAPSALPQKPGDANGDTKVDGIDYVVWLNHYNQAFTGPTYGDFNNNSIVDGIDYVIWITNYGK